MDTREINRIEKKMRTEICKKCRELQPSFDCDKGGCKTMMQMDAIKSYTKQDKQQCICGGKMIIFESNFGGHEGQFCLVCEDRFSTKEPHLESNNWYPNKELLEQALKEGGKSNCLNLEDITELYHIGESPKSKLCIKKEKVDNGKA